MTQGAPLGTRARDPAADVLDLDVRIDGGLHGPFTLRVEFGATNTSSGEAVPFVSPMPEAELAEFAATLAQEPGRHLHAPGRGTRAVTAGAEEIGRRLCASIFSGATRDILVQARTVARLGRALLRIRLKLDGAPPVARLPWELMLDDTGYLAQTVDQFVVRFTDTREPPPPARRGGPLRILVVAASPSDLERLDLDREYAALVASVTPAGDRVVVERLEEPTVEGLQRALTHEWHVVHFIGHGDETEAGGVIALVGEDGNRDIVTADQLAVMLDRPQLRLVVLNGCSTGAVPRHQPQNGVAHQLVVRGVPAAVANQFPITDASATAFAGALYERLAAGALIDEAMVHARMRLLRTPEWVTPVLFARSGARLFEPPAAPPLEDSQPVRVRDRVPPGSVPADDVFQPRPWVLEELSTWLDSSSPALLLTGGIGAGKTTLAGWLAGVGPLPEDADAARTLERARAAWKGVRIGTANLVGGVLDPRALIRSLADQLAASVPGFVAADHSPAGLLNASLDEMFEVQLERPLRACGGRDAEPILLLIDGLDDSGPPQGPNARDVVARLVTIDGVPLRVMVTAPDDASLLSPFLNLREVARIDLSGASRRAEVSADVAAYLGRRLGSLGVDPAVADSVAAAADGNFLYASLAADDLEADPEATADPLDLPSGLDELYERWIRRTLERSHGAEWEDQWEDSILPVLGPLAIARAPVPFASLSAWLGWTGPRLAAQLDDLQQLVVAKEEGYTLAHRSLGAMLARPTFATHRANALVVDVRGAHRRVVEHAIAATDADLAAADATGLTYGLVHAPGHLAQLSMLGGADNAQVDALAARAVSSPWSEAIAAHVVDPVLLGTPYRDLVGLLLDRGDTGTVEKLVTVLARTPAPVLRGVVFEVLTAYVAKDHEAAARFMVGLVATNERELQAIALHATCLLSARAQATVFRTILSSRGEDIPDDLASAAAFALYANGTAKSQDLIRDVLMEVLTDLSVRSPRRSAALVKFFGQVTVTNYINHCDEPAVAQLTSDLWEELLVRRLRIRVINQGLIERLVVRPLLVHQLARRIAHLFSSAETEDWPGSQGAELAGAAEAHRVIRVLDPAVPIGPVEPDLSVLLRSDVTLLRVLAVLAVSVHAVRNPEVAEPLVDRITSSADERGRRWLLMGHAVLLRGTPHSWIPVLERATRAVLTAAHADETEGALKGLHLTFVPLGLAYAKAGVPMTLMAEVLESTPTGEDDGRRGCCLMGLGITGLYYPDAALGAIGHLVEEEVLTLDEAQPAFAMMAGVHPLRTRAWLLERGGRGVLDSVWGAVDVDLSRQHLEVLGMFNNGVQEAVEHPQMRTRLCMTVFEFFLGTRTLRQWLDRYTSESLAMLREADYQLIRWTE